jgi:hypothetical protein
MRYFNAREFREKGPENLAEELASKSLKGVQGKVPLISQETGIEVPHNRYLIQPSSHDISMGFIVAEF